MRFCKKKYTGKTNQRNPKELAERCERRNEGEGWGGLRWAES
jgi:hypothetical protein